MDEGKYTMGKNVQKSSVQKTLIEKSPTYELELQAHLAEFDSLRQENNRILGERQQFVLGALAGIVTLIGVALDKSLFTTTISVKFYLFVPFAFTSLTWWYIRNYHTIILMEKYALTKLQPRIQALAGKHAFGWTDFLWKAELSFSGKFIISTQTFSKIALVQGGAFLSLLNFGYQTQWNWHKWEIFDWMLIIANFIGLVVTFVLLIITRKILQEIQGLVSK